MPDSRLQRGKEKLREIHGQRGVDVMDRLAEIVPDLERYTYEFAFGDIYSRPGLDTKTRQICTVVALAAMGNAAPQLKSHIHGAMNCGWTKGEILEALIQMAVYAGFPAAINAVMAAKEVFEERG